LTTRQQYRPVHGDNRDVVQIDGADTGAAAEKVKIGRSAKDHLQKLLAAALTAYLKTPPKSGG
jgi:hypothetical protein